MATLVRTPQAAEDLIEIYLYIAHHNEPAAERLIHELHAQCQLLAERPGIGRLRDDLRPGMRTWPHRSYLILYRAIDGGAEIVRVVHGARNIPDLV